MDAGKKLIRMNLFCMQPLIMQFIKLTNYFINLSNWIIRTACQTVVESLIVLINSIR